MVHIQHNAIWAIGATIHNFRIYKTSHDDQVVELVGARFRWATDHLVEVIPQTCGPFVSVLGDTYPELAPILGFDRKAPFQFLGQPLSLYQTSRHPIIYPWRHRPWLFSTIPQTMAGYPWTSEVLTVGYAGDSSQWTYEFLSGGIQSWRSGSYKHWNTQH